MGIKASRPVKPSCVVLFASFSLLDVHTKKVRKVPPGLPSSVSDNMPFFSLLLFRWCGTTAILSARFTEKKASARLEKMAELRSLRKK